MSLSFQTPLYLVLIFIAVSFAVSYYLYRHTIPQVTRTKRMILTALRGTALTFVLLAVCEPIVQLISSQIQKPVIAVLADNSLSMSQTDALGNKEHILSSLLKSDALKEFSSSADVKLFSFSHSVSPLEQESLKVNGGITNISSALQTSLKNIDNLQGIILLSDGNYTEGSNPLYDAEKSRIPIFTIGIGDTNEQKDISVSKLIVNSIGYVDAAIPVDATIKVSGIPAQTVLVSLLEDGKKISEQKISVSAPSGATEIPAQFKYIPSSEGVKKLSVAVSSIPGELTTKNNVRSALVKVLKNKMNVVVIAGSPSADVSAIMQSLNQDKNIIAPLFYQIPGGEFKSQKENISLQSSLTSADCIIFVGFPTALTSQNSMSNITQSILSRSLPVLFIASRTLDLQKVGAMQSLFPFIVSSERIDEQSVLPNVFSKTKFHQLLQNESSVWEKLPPVYYSMQTFSVKPEALNLLGVKIQNVPLNDPLFITRNIAGTKSAAILGYGIHRWKLLAGSTNETKLFFDVWFTSLIRWLATREQDKFMRVEPSKEFYSQGEQVEFSAQVYNQSYQPIDNADVRLSLHSKQNSLLYETILSSLGSGRYEGSIESLSEGEFTYTAVAMNDRDTLGTSQGRISVGDQSIEFAETRMNKSLLTQLARSSEGEYSDANEFNSLLQNILQRNTMKPQTIEQTNEFELWNLPAFLTIIVLLFGIEWLVRKQSGML
ncbi:MAG: VWA domain-containing protein [Bacteroidota bacterium]|nr:VWA domain-containing protein [Bacteroidota bacterium]